MEKEKIKQMLQSVRDNTMSVEEALDSLRHLPYEDIGFAMVDSHRSIRKGFPEVIFCQGKDVSHIVEIAGRLMQKNSTIIATRAGKEVSRALESRFEGVFYNELARFVRIGPAPVPSTERRSLVVTAGTADLPVAEEAALTAEALGCATDRLFDVGVAGIHRLFGNIQKIHDAGLIIVAAGMDGALPSIIGGIASCPVIAVPTSVGYGASFGGLAALLTMLNSCAPGVLTVNIDNGFGAGYAAAMILHGDKR